MKEVRLILGDQLNASHAWLAKPQPDVVYVMMEMRQETDYVRHHIQKLVAFFLAMRSFAQDLRNAGHEVLYLALDDPRNTQDLVKNLSWICGEHRADKFAYQLPDEYRLDRQLSTISKELNIAVEAVDTEHFFTSRTFLADFFRGKKTYLMESFYRALRKKTGILMEHGAPLSGRWNYDAENRKKLPAKHSIPLPKVFEQDVSEILTMLKKSGVTSIGKINQHAFLWPVTRAECLGLLEHFCKECLPFFGMFQDAMTGRDWSIYHSRLSFAMNAKILSPAEVIDRVLDEWQLRLEEINIAQVEGFIRQILGWREFMRGVYWAHMPEYADKNFFGHDRKLPEFYWTGDTRMSCMRYAIEQSLEYAYAHHIQRLMVTGNFALLTGVDPEEVDAWYLGIYIDAVEWVEITNTRGMSQFADGGIVGTKPYVSSANYIHKMSDYCATCYYDRKARTGDRACPFNSFYWHFYARNRDLLIKNPRIGMAYRLWDKMDPETQQEILDQADYYLEHLDEL